MTALLTPYISSGEPLPFGQLQLEIHIWHKSFAEYLTWWETLEAAGLRPFWTEVRFPIKSRIACPHPRDPSFSLI